MGSPVSRAPPLGRGGGAESWSPLDCFGSSALPLPAPCSRDVTTPTLYPVLTNRCQAEKRHSEPFPGHTIFQGYGGEGAPSRHIPFASSPNSLGKRLVLCCPMYSLTLVTECGRQQPRTAALWGSPPEDGMAWQVTSKAAPRAGRMLCSLALISSNNMTTVLLHSVQQSPQPHTVRLYQSQARSRLRSARTRAQGRGRRGKTACARGGDRFHHSTSEPWAQPERGNPSPMGGSMACPRPRPQEALVWAWVLLGRQRRRRRFGLAACGAARRWCSRFRLAAFLLLHSPVYSALRRRRGADHARARLVWSQRVPHLIWPRLSPLPPATGQSAARRNGSQEQEKCADGPKAAADGTIFRPPPGLPVRPGRACGTSVCCVVRLWGATAALDSHATEARHFAAAPAATHRHRPVFRRPLVLAHMPFDQSVKRRDWLGHKNRVDALTLCVVIRVLMGGGGVLCRGRHAALHGLRGGPRTGHSRGPHQGRRHTDDGDG